MNAKVTALLEAWDRNLRYQTMQQMLASVVAGDLAETQRVLDAQPLIEWFVPFGAQSWAEVAAAAGQAGQMRFWLARDAAAARPAVSNDDLFLWSMGHECVSPAAGDATALAESVLDQGASIDGKPKAASTPLHHAVFRDRPDLVALLIRRGADLSQPYENGESALQIARRLAPGGACAKLLEQAGAPLQARSMPKPSLRPQTVDLRKSAEKVKAEISKAVRRFARRHGKEALTAIALACTPHEGYVMVSFDTGKFEGSPWDATYPEFEWIKFPDWVRAHEPDTMNLIDLDGRSSSGGTDGFEEAFMAMLLQVLKGMEAEGTFASLAQAAGCRIGVEMTGMGEGKFWVLRAE
jgi:hypothetical protein